MHFKDYFSAQSVDYARYRPDYPPEMFNYITGLVNEKNIAWDCATGNGQAANGLSVHFNQVIATDASFTQIINSVASPNIHYSINSAEESPIKDNSINLVTVAQAIHWFNLENFYKEVKRVLVSGGILAVWCYNLLKISPEIDNIINRTFYEEILRGYWPPERKMIDEKYSKLYFPFEKLVKSNFRIEKQLCFEELLGYLFTWSGTQNFIKKNNENPIEQIYKSLLSVWKDAKLRKTVSWPITLFIGKM